jgi:hypothetical protein
MNVQRGFDAARAGKDSMSESTEPSGHDAASLPQPREVK